MRLEQVCSNILNKNQDVLSIILTGSRARGDNRNDSDYDIVFVTKKGNSYNLSENYEKQITEKVDVNKGLVNVYLYPLWKFKKFYDKGNSFIHTTLRDGKILASREKTEKYIKNLNLNFPNRLFYGAYDRLKITKENLDFIINFLTYLQWDIDDLSLERLGYCSMHLCWIACMLDNFCPKSKYTALEESRKYFTEKEFEAIKNAYRFYAYPNTNRKISRKNFLKMHNSLNKIYERINSEHKSNIDKGRQEWLEEHKKN